MTKANLGNILLTLLMLLLSYLFFENLPETLPLRFDLNGTPSNYQPKLLAVLIMPIALVISLVAVRGLIAISPPQYTMPKSQRAIKSILFGIGLLFSCCHLAILFYDPITSLHTKLVSVGIALLLVVIGNVWGKTERNFFIGLRLPWTIASEANWKATHRLAGKLMVIAGLALVPASFLTSSLLPAIFLIVASAVIPAFYSYWYFINVESNIPNKV